MRLHWTLGTALVLSVLTVAGQSLAAESGGSRLTDMASRQNLRDFVCLAMADGRISQTERRLILTDAKEILPHAEYLKFKMDLDRLSPPKPSKSKQQLAKSMHKKPSSQPTQPMQQQQAQQQVQQEPSVDTVTGPVIPTGAILPDRMAPAKFFR
jgi:hypothetical protein